MAEEIKYLKMFSPAENLAILEGSQVSFGNQMKFTLMDLFFKGVFMTTQIQRMSLQGKEETYHYVVEGKNFRTYKPMIHEMVFMMPYYKSKGIKILFQASCKNGFSKCQCAFGPFFFRLKEKNPFFFQTKCFSPVHQ